MTTTTDNNDQELHEFINTSENSPGAEARFPIIVKHLIENLSPNMRSGDESEYYPWIIRMFAAIRAMPSSTQDELGTKQHDVEMLIKILSVLLGAEPENKWVKRALEDLPEPANGNDAPVAIYDYQFATKKVTRIFTPLDIKNKREAISRTVAKFKEKLKFATAKQKKLIDFLEGRLDQGIDIAVHYANLSDDHYPYSYYIYRGRGPTSDKGCRSKKILEPGQKNYNWKVTEGLVDFELQLLGIEKQDSKIKTNEVGDPPDLETDEDLFEISEKLGIRNGKTKSGIYCKDHRHLLIHVPSHRNYKRHGSAQIERKKSFTYYQIGVPLITIDLSIEYLKAKELPELWQKFFKEASPETIPHIFVDHDTTKPANGMYGKTAFSNEFKELCRKITIDDDFFQPKNAQHFIAMRRAQVALARILHIPLHQVFVYLYEIGKLYQK